MKYYLSIGSNVGDREIYLQTALNQISKIWKIVKISSIYETSPVGVEEKQDMYLNMVISVLSEIDPEKMLKTLKRIEKEMGRDIYNSHLKPRKIDIDILFCDEKIIDTKMLKIPHKEIEKRKFVLIPLFEINPELINPLNGISVKKMLQNCKDEGEVYLFKNELRIKR